ncbi:MAG: FG-GAP repeat domain-containing protein, partial [Acidimicrobiia bacterium]
MVELYGPGLRLMQRADATESGGQENITTGVGSGRYYLRVSNFGATAGPGPYQVRVSPAPDPEAGEFRFRSIETRTLPASAASVAIGDLTGDGANDILVSTEGADAQDHDLFLYRQSAGGFEPPRAIPTRGTGDSRSDMGLALGDLDGDGDLDAAVGTAAGVEVHYQSGGGLGPPVLVGAQAAQGVAQVEIGDVDGDGRQDLVVATSFDGVRVLSSGGGSSSIVTSEFAPAIEVADVNGDGRDDIAAWECTDRCWDIAVYA